MAEITTKRISELIAAQDIGDSDLFVIEQGGAAKKAAGSVVKGAIGGSSLPPGGTPGQVLTKTADGTEWDDVSGLPDGGSNGQVLTKTSDGAAWSDVGTPTQAQTNAALADYLDEHPEAVTNLPDRIKQALLACFSNVAWISSDGQTYYQNLYNALANKKVVAINAVFEQGQNAIYTHDSLDDLKQYLTVTALYDDGTTGVAIDYELSGTLAAGTSTITVTYYEKTTTFDVTVTQGVPSGYTVYDSIYMPVQRNNVASDKWIALKQYDDLNALSAEFELKPIINVSEAATIGRRSATGYTSSFGFYPKGTTLGWHLHGAEATQEPPLVFDEVNIVKYMNTSASPSSLQTNDNTPVSVAWSNTNVLNLAPVLFSNPVNNSVSNMSHNAKLGNIKFFNLSGELVGNYFPVVRTVDQRIGMFDLVDQVFYTTSSAAYSTIGNANCYYAVESW